MNRGDIVSYSVAERLRDGRIVTIRAIRPDDKGLVIEAFHEMSSESIYRRLFALKKELTDKDLKLVTEVDFVDVVQLVAVLEKDGRDHLAGGGRYMRTGGSGTEQRAEVAFLIDDEFQGLGIAPRVFKHLVAIARASGITHLEAEVLPTNEAMLKVFSRSGIPFTRTGSPEFIYLLMDLTGQ